MALVQSSPLDSAFWTNLPAILRELPTQPLGILSLAILLVGVIVIYLTRRTDQIGYRYMAVAACLIGLLMMGGKILASSVGVSKLEGRIEFTVVAGQARLVTHESNQPRVYRFHNSSKVQYNVEIINQDGHGKEVVTLNPGETHDIGKSAIHSDLQIVAHTSGTARGWYQRLE